MQEIILFNRCISTANVDFKIVNELAIEKGLIVHPDCCNDRVWEYLNTLPTNYNSTFYQSWKDVISKSRFELLIDQILHYSSTYGTNFTGTPFIPNEGIPKINFVDCKVILPINEDELQQKIQSLFNSGIALEQNTINYCLHLVDEFLLEIDFASIKNKEVMMYVCKKLNILPTSAEEMVRYLVYLYTDKTLLIKSPELIREIKSKNLNISNLINRFGKDKLSSVFYRFKPLFLAMKPGNSVIINLLRRAAVRNHIPKQFGFWSQILSNVSLFSHINEQLVNLNNYKLIALLQTILVRKKETGILPVVIRNGKVFVTEKNFSNKNYYTLVYDVLYKELITRLSKKASTVKLPNLELALPTSEKSFIGHLPLGSKVILSTDSVVGINWKNTDGADDLDLSLIDNKGDKIGWNSGYYNSDNSVIYSGDQTSANPEATELMYCKNTMPNSIVKVNAFRAETNSKYTLFFAKVSDMQVNKNQMVDPNDIIFSIQLTIDGENINGSFIDGNFYFLDLKSGNSRVSKNSSYIQNLISHKEKTADCYLNLKKVLQDAGFEIVTNDAKLDLTVPDKSLLIELLNTGV